MEETLYMRKINIMPQIHTQNRKMQRFSQLSWYTLIAQNLPVVVLVVDGKYWYPIWLG